MATSINQNESVAGVAKSQSLAEDNNLDVLGQPHTESPPPIHSESDRQEFLPVGKVTAKNVLRLLDFQKRRCALTGRQLEPETASLDHIVPVRCGGAHAIENTQLLHKNVNRAKSTMTNDEFVQMCHEVALHAARNADRHSQA